MSTSLFLQKTETLAVEAFKRPKDTRKLRQSHVAFSGTPRKHPDDPLRIILVVDPFSTNTFYYEFNLDDIAFVEELPNLINVDEDVIPMVRIWIKKGCLGLRCAPFIVDDVL
jgi:inorganic pyrophosphatase